MKVTDLIAKFLKKNKVNQVFGLQGGAVVHIFDSLFKQGYSEKDDGSFQPMNLEEMYPFTKGYISNTNN
jgi:hypothetical protein